MIRPLLDPRTARIAAWSLAIVALLATTPATHAQTNARTTPPRSSAAESRARLNGPTAVESETAPSDATGLANLDPRLLGRSLPTIVLFGLVSMAPVALLMLTGFVRISIVLTLLRQALGSPQVPGNQVITALSLMLTALVMWPHGEAVYRGAIEPYASGRMTPVAAWDAGLRPIKAYMLEQLEWRGRLDYLEALADCAEASDSDRPKSRSASRHAEDYPFRVIAPAYLLEELTTGLLIGFYIYLPFLVVDLVVSAVLAATGLFMLPPSLVAMPAKLILFVLVDGWLQVSTMLLRSFGPPAG